MGAESGCAAYVDTYSLAKWVCLESNRTMLGATALSKAISAKIKVHMLVIRCNAEYCEPVSCRKGGPAAHNIMLLNHIGARVKLCKPKEVMLGSLVVRCSPALIPHKT